MDQVFQIALAYGNGKLTSDALDFALRKLGKKKESDEVPFTYGMPFTGGKFKINPLKMIANQGIKGIASGGGGSSFFAGAAPFLAGGLGLAYLTNPLRKGSYNYSPELQGQIDFLSDENMINRDNSAGLLRYGPKSVLRNQNVVSGFGTNNYMQQLKNYINKFDKYGELTEGQKAKKKRGQKELDTFIKETIDIGDGNEGGKDFGRQGASDIPDRKRGQYSTDDTSSFFSKGGIASL
jgi:hypothetical protein